MLAATQINVPRKRNNSNSLICNMNCTNVERYMIVVVTLLPLNMLEVDFYINVITTVCVLVKILYTKT